MKLHTFTINELLRGRGRSRAWHHMRRFWHFYRKDGSPLLEAHLETIVQKTDRHPISTRLSIDPSGESPWRGHILIFGTGFFWGHNAFRGLAEKLTKCSGYKWDTREWGLRISDSTLSWELGNHDDMCAKKREVREEKRRGTKKKRKRVTWRRGAVNISLAQAIWGPKRYTYEDVDSYVTTVKLPEDSYAVVLRLQKVFFGRTKVPKHKHEMSWTIDVDAPKGVPTHYDSSGGYKGDRTYGWGVAFDYPRSEGWQQDAEAAVTAWVLKERARTGFRKPQEV